MKETIQELIPKDQEFLEAYKASQYVMAQYTALGGSVNLATLNHMRDVLSYCKDVISQRSASDWADSNSIQNQAASIRKKRIEQLSTEGAPDVADGKKLSAAKAKQVAEAEEAQAKLKTELLDKISKLGYQRVDSISEMLKAIAGRVRQLENNIIPEAERDIDHRFESPSFERIEAIVNRGERALQEVKETLQVSEDTGALPAQEECEVVEAEEVGDVEAVSLDSPSENYEDFGDEAILPPDDNMEVYDDGTPNPGDEDSPYDEFGFLKPDTSSSEAPTEPEEEEKEPDVSDIPDKIEPVKDIVIKKGKRKGTVTERVIVVDPPEPVHKSFKKPEGEFEVWQ